MKKEILTATLATFLFLLAFTLNALAQTNIPGPAGSGQFGTEIYALPSGNIVVVDPYYSIPNGATNVGAVYLYNGGTGEPISTLTGSTENDNVGFATDDLGNFLQPGVVVLPNGNFLVKSFAWNHLAGAVTLVDGVKGLSGVVSASNSLVGSNTGDLVGFLVTVLANGNYVVRSDSWNNDVGAVTLGNGSTGVKGAVSQTNSLIGAAAGDRIGSNGVIPLTNGNYVVRSQFWNGGYDGRGAVTFGNGNSGTNGVVSAANSLVGETAGDSVGEGPVAALSNGNYVVASPGWDDGGASDVGAATFGNGATGVKGQISAANSLIGSSQFDRVGTSGITALTNGNYVVSSSSWNNNAGAATFGNGITGVKGEISAANSLVGVTGDRVGSGGVVALTNENYVVSSPNWTNGAISASGAATFANGTSGIKGMISAANSLVGTKANDSVGSSGIVALSNGNYVVCSQEWDNGATQDAGAATFGDGTTGIKGNVSAANSLVGASANDNVGFIATALLNGNYVVGSPNWDRGSITDAGSSTFGDGTTGVRGTVSSANSLVGSKDGDQVGGTFSGFSGGVSINLLTPLTNGNYLISSPFWDNGAVMDEGAVTLADGTTGITGEISVSNSLVGSKANDQIGFYRNAGNGIVAPTITALPNGNYAVGSPGFDNNAVTDAGALTYGNGTGGTVGPIGAANSFLGIATDGQVGLIYAFDSVHGRLVAGQPSENLVTLVTTRGTLLNISTRLQVGTDDQVLIGGFIITGTDPKMLILRAIGPSLSDAGIANPLADPVLELRGADGSLITSNDNWQTTQKEAIEGTGIPPKSPFESAIVVTLEPGSYTAIVSGKNGSTGVGLVEAYDLNPAADSQLANISTRGFVDTGSNVMIGGFILGGADDSITNVLIRALGPSLSEAGVSGALADPTLELRDENGALVRSNDNWMAGGQQAEIESTGIPPTKKLEAAVVAVLNPGSYTAIVAGQGGGTGVGLVEVYRLP